MICPCCSGKEYAQCCERFHRGELPQNALELMRSRYSAYALNKPEYIIATTHPANPHYVQDQVAWKKGIEEFIRHTVFHKLEILELQEEKEWATVTFTAYLSQGGEDTTFTERSEFERVKGQWLYREGILTRQGERDRL